MLKDVQQRVADVTTQRRGEHRRRARGQGVRAGGARGRALPAAGPSASSTRRSPPPRMQARYVPAAAGAAQPRRSPPCCWSAADRSSTARSRWARSSPSTGTCCCSWCRCAASACGSASTSARWPPASASSRCSTSTATSSSAPDARAAARRAPAHIRFEPRRVRLRRPSRPVLRDIDLDIAAGQHRRADRPDRLRQDDPDHADPALLRRRPRAGAASTAPTSATLTLDSLRAAGRHRQPGHLPVLDHRGREHRLRRAGRDARGDRHGRPSRPRRTTSSATCPTATRRASASAA